MYIIYFNFLGTEVVLVILRIKSNLGEIMGTNICII